jgi:hypothetical protein
MPARQPTTPPVSRLRNWNQDHDAWVRRGSLTRGVDQDTLQAWRSQGPTQRGAPFESSDTASEGLLTLRSVYPLSLRAPRGSPPRSSS